MDQNEIGNELPTAEGDIVDQPATGEGVEETTEVAEEKPETLQE